MLKGGNLQVSKELHRYSIYQQKSRFRQTFKSNGRNKAASRTANENRQRDDGLSTILNANRERILYFATHYLEVSNCARMDVLRQRVLPVNSTSQQAEVVPVGTATPWSVIRGCHMD